jgi:hypothetical protein
LKISVNNNSASEKETFSLHLIFLSFCFHFFKFMRYDVRNIRKLPPFNQLGWLLYHYVTKFKSYHYLTRQKKFYKVNKLIILFETFYINLPLKVSFLFCLRFYKISKWLLLICVIFYFISITILGLGLWCLMPLSTIFQLFVVVSFIGGGNRSTGRKPLTCRKSLANFIT